MTGIVFLDTETTGLDPVRHEIWEVGLIVDDKEYHWFLPVDLSAADAVALNIGGYHDRHPHGLHKVPGNKTRCVSVVTFAKEFARLTWGKHLVGAVVSFDEERLRKLLIANGQTYGWHYHLVDVEALMVGYLAGRQRGDRLYALETIHTGIAPPWNSKDLSGAVGVDPDLFEAHTAIGDARWARACYEAVMPL